MVKVRHGRRHCGASHTVGQGSQLRSDRGRPADAFTAAASARAVLAAMKARARPTAGNLARRSGTTSGNARGRRNEERGAPGCRSRCWPPRRASVPARGQGVRCGAGKDLVVQALERITPQSGNDAFEDALQLLKHAVQECSELGDAWYYRSLVEQRLGHDALAKYAMDKARFNDSEALAAGIESAAAGHARRARIRRGRSRGRDAQSWRAHPEQVEAAGTGRAEVGAGRGHRPLHRQQYSTPELYDRGRKFLCSRTHRSADRAFSREPCPCAHR